MPNFNDITTFFGSSLFGQTYVPNVGLSSKTIVITGGNTGLGYDCAKHLLGLGVSRLILACRDVSKGETAKARLASMTEQAAGNKIEVWQVDLDHYASVLEFCNRINTQLDRLDGFVANAGLELEKFEKSEDYERTLTVNVISTMLIVYGILPKLQRTHEAYHVQTNLSIVGSLIHIMAPVNQIVKAQQHEDGDTFAALSVEGTADMSQRYPLSKLLLHLCFVGLTEHTQRQGLEGVTINLINPGWCKTSLSRAKNMGIGERLAALIFQRTSEAGSRTLVHGVVAGSETHGKYLSECQVKQMSNFMRSQEGMDASRQVFKDLISRLETISRGITVITNTSAK